MKRSEKFVFETEEKEIILDISTEAGKVIINVLPNALSNAYSELPAISAGEYAEVLSVYTDKHGNQAVIPPGWTVSGARKENSIWGKNKGLVIYRIPQRSVKNINWSSKQMVGILQETCDQLTWCPVEMLTANGTIDGNSFTEKFGRRCHDGSSFFCDYYEILTDELILQTESVKKYGGFYISRYNISKNNNTGDPQSIRGAIPWTNITADEAIKVATLLEKNDTITSHLPFGAEYDSVLEWFINSKTKRLKNIAYDSTNWGNYYSIYNFPGIVVRTGREEKWCTNNIYDFSGNVRELTQERVYDGYVIRGECRVNNSTRCSVSYRNSFGLYRFDQYTGFRAVLYIK